MANRFDYVKYDETANSKQIYIKGMFKMLEEYIGHNLPMGRAIALSLTSLEEAYMWLGKAIRDEQISRNGSESLQAGRDETSQQD